MSTQLVYALLLVFPAKTLDPFLKASANPIVLFRTFKSLAVSSYLFVPFNLTVLVLAGMGIPAKIPTWRILVAAIY